MDKEKELQERLTTNKDRIKYVEAVISEVENKKIAIASQETVDRQGEIISIDGWDFKNFKRNPVMLWGHNAYEPNIGEVKNIRITDVNGKKSVVFEPVFHDITPLSQTLHEMYDQGKLRAFSVGFLPFEAEGNKFTKQELLEVSLVNVPAHPNALNIAYAKGMTKAEVKKVFGVTKIKEEKVEETEDAPVDERDEKIKTLKDKLKKSKAKRLALEKKLADIESEKALPTKAADQPQDDKAIRSIRRSAIVVDRAIEKILKALK